MVKIFVFYRSGLKLTLNKGRYIKYFKSSFARTLRANIDCRLRQISSRVSGISIAPLAQISIYLNIPSSTVAATTVPLLHKARQSRAGEGWWVCLMVGFYETLTEKSHKKGMDTSPIVCVKSSFDTFMEKTVDICFSS